MFSLDLVYSGSVYLFCLYLHSIADYKVCLCVVSVCVCLCISADALFVDGVVGVSQQDVRETGLQQVHGEEGRLLHNLKQKRNAEQLLDDWKYTVILSSKLEC